MALMMTIMIIMIIIMINMQSSLIASSGLPKLTETPTDVLVEPGKTFKLFCKAQGHPSPTLLWQKDGGRSFPAADDRRIKYAEDLEVCEIRNAQYKDSGKYTCFAKNDAGSVNASAIVTVLGETDSSLFFAFVFLFNLGKAFIEISFLLRSVSFTEFSLVLLKEAGKVEANGIHLIININVHEWIY